MKKVLCMVLVFVMISATIPILAEGSFTYEHADGSAYLTKYTGSDEEIVIPETVPSINGESVVRGISQNAFENCDTVKKITIPDTVETIGKGAFSGCTSLEEIVIPDSVGHIYEYTFIGCANLKRVVLGEGMIEVMGTGFTGCKIDTLVVMNPKTKLYSTGRSEFYSHGSKKSYYVFASFEQCEIGTINAPVGSEAEKFAKENNINFVPFESSAGDFACEIVNDEAVITKYMGNSEVVIIPEEFNGYKVTQISTEAFRNNDTIRKVVLPESVNVIGQNAFTGCGNLCEIDIKNVETIGNYAFAYCNNLKTVAHSGKLKSIGAHAFYLCESLIEINIEGVEELGQGAFRSCSSLKSVTLLNLKTWYSVPEERIDMEQKRVYKIIYPDLVRTDFESIVTPFFECTSLEEVRIRWPEKSDGEDFEVLFFNCPALKKVTFENFTAKPSDGEFYNIWYSTQPKAYMEQWATMKERPTFTLYGYDEKVKAYADEMGIRCEIILTPEAEEQNKAWDTPHEPEKENHLVVVTELFDKLGITYYINTETKTVGAMNDGIIVLFTAGRSEVYKNGVQLILPEAVKEVDGKIFVNEKVMCELFGLIK